MSLSDASVAIKYPTLLSSHPEPLEEDTKTLDGSTVHLAIVHPDAASDPDALAEGSRTLDGSIDRWASVHPYDASYPDAPVEESKPLNTSIVHQVIVHPDDVYRAMRMEAIIDVIRKASVIKKSYRGALKCHHRFVGLQKYKPNHLKEIPPPRSSEHEPGCTSTGLFAAALKGNVLLEMKLYSLFSFKLLSTRSSSPKHRHRHVMQQHYKPEPRKDQAHV